LISRSFWEDTHFGPSQPAEDRDHLTREAILAAHQHGQRVNILTKAGKLSKARDQVRSLLPLLGRDDIFGVTLTCLDEDHREFWEPNAAPTWVRVDNLKLAHDLGIQTRASLEPVLYPEQTLELIRLIRPFTDLIQVGKLNVHAGDPPEVLEREKAIDWPAFGHYAWELLRSMPGMWYVKADLAREVGVTGGMGLRGSTLG